MRAGEERIRRNLEAKDAARDEYYRNYSVGAQRIIRPLKTIDYDYKGASHYFVTLEIN